MRNLFRAVMYILINILLFLIYYLNWYSILSLLQYSSFFFSFHTTWCQSNKAVQQAVTIIATPINDYIFRKRTIHCLIEICTFDGIYIFKNILLSMCVSVTSGLNRKLSTFWRFKFSTFKSSSFFLCHWGVNGNVLNVHSVESEWCRVFGQE